MVSQILKKSMIKNVDDIQDTCLSKRVMHDNDREHDNDSDNGETKPMTIAFLSFLLCKKATYWTHHKRNVVSLAYMAT
jgi:hypothetical protein